MTAKYHFWLLFITGFIVVFYSIFHDSYIKEKKAIKQITSLQIPEECSNFKIFRQSANPGDLYPYFLFAKFKISKNGYLKMVSPALINRLDSNNKIFKQSYGKSLMPINLFWEIDSIDVRFKPDWWGFPSKVEMSLLYANLFNDQPTKLGDTTLYNGRIYTYYHENYCFLYLNCWGG